MMFIDDCEVTCLFQIQTLIWMAFLRYLYSNFLVNLLLLFCAKKLHVTSFPVICS